MSLQQLFTGNRKRIAIWWGFAAVGTYGLFHEAYDFGRWERANAEPPPVPVITQTRPHDGETGVLPNAFVAADVFLPNFGHGIMSSTMNTQTVKLFKVLPSGKTLDVPGHVNTSGAGDAIVFQPQDMLDPGATYRFSAEGVMDTGAAQFRPFAMSFKTAPATSLSAYPVAFEKVPLPTTSNFGNIFIGLTIGPDHRLYAGTYDGRILRYDITADGTLGKPTTLRTVINANRGPDNTTGNRLVTGLCFDPRSTPDNPILWVTHGVMALEHCPDWSCKLSRISGPNLDHYQDYVVGLPRAWRDHLSFKIAFGPDGGLYFDQGSNSSTGAADNKWGRREEHLLNAACLRLDTDAVAARLDDGQGPLNVKTEDGGRYNPWAPDAPLTVYATGIRCGFSLLWHTNGHLYSCVNGGAAGGEAPGTPNNLAEVPRRIDQAVRGPYTGPEIQAVGEVTETQPDLFVDLVKGGYFGHPNITRGEYILNGGNPDDGKDDYQVHDYPKGTPPDRNWHRPALNLGLSRSCNGLIEYHGDAFGGALKGKILTCRYSGGKDIMLISLNPNGTVKETVTGIDGFTQFVDPLDLVEDRNNGFIYVSEFGGQRLTLLRPKHPAQPGGDVESRRVFRESKAAHLAD